MQYLGPLPSVLHQQVLHSSLNDLFGLHLKLSLSISSTVKRSPLSSITSRGSSVVTLPSATAVTSSASAASVVEILSEASIFSVVVLAVEVESIGFLVVFIALAVEALSIDGDIVVVSGISLASVSSKSKVSSTSGQRYFMVLFVTTRVQSGFMRD